MGEFKNGKRNFEMLDSWFSMGTGAQIGAALALIKEWDLFSPGYYGWWRQHKNVNSFKENLAMFTILVFINVLLGGMIGAFFTPFVNLLLDISCFVYVKALFLY